MFPHDDPAALTLLARLMRNGIAIGEAIGSLCPDALRLAGEPQR